jgi:hypothetical protein
LFVKFTNALAWALARSGSVTSSVDHDDTTLRRPSSVTPLSFPQPGSDPLFDQ